MFNIPSKAKLSAVKEQFYILSAIINKEFDTYKKLNPEILISKPFPQIGMKLLDLGSQIGFGCKNWNKLNIVSTSYSSNNESDEYLPIINMDTEEEQLLILQNILSDFIKEDEQIRKEISIRTLAQLPTRMSRYSIMDESLDITSHCQAPMKIFNVKVEVLNGDESVCFEAENATIEAFSRTLITREVCWVCHNQQTVGVPCELIQCDLKPKENTKSASVLHKAGMQYMEELNSLSEKEINYIKNTANNDVSQRGISALHKAGVKYVQELNSLDSEVIIKYQSHNSKDIDGNNNIH